MSGSNLSETGDNSPTISRLAIKDELELDDEMEPHSSSRPSKRFAYTESRHSGI